MEAHSRGWELAKRERRRGCPGETLEVIYSIGIQKAQLCLEKTEPPPKKYATF